MNQSVLDAGLSVLSLTTGPVLGAFLIGVLTRHVGSRAMLIGMLCGALAMFVIWQRGLLAWTWYALAGATITSVIALALAALPGFRVPPGDRVPARA
jgi:Na+/proline symporter